MPIKELAVSAEHLSRHFGSFHAVQDVNFHIPEGEIFGLLGPNGAGKTTTIRMLCGILPPSRGEATVLGFNVRSHPEQVKKRIGYMSQLFSLYNDLTVEENIRFYASIYGLQSKVQNGRVEELLKEVDLAAFRRERTANLSGAWRQRLALACAIAHRPRMLFLDEATAGVDPLARKEFWDLIYRMASQGVSILATTHYMDEAEYCNMIGMMHEGSLIALDTPDAMRARIGGNLFQLTVDRPLAAEELLRTLPVVKEVSLHGVLLHVQMKTASDTRALRRKLHASGIHVADLTEIEPSLEDVFISLVDEQDQHKIQTRKD
ncbi:MAG: ABC transporter ATP-binding protein [Anaerolineae bacterium]|nr:ABC transporter ATP-binding protein [Anaerolineae bacterium]